MVGGHSESSSRPAFPHATSDGPAHHRRQPLGLGRSLPILPDTRNLEQTTKTFPYQSARIASDLQGPKVVPTLDTGSRCANSHRQHHGPTLYKQTRGHSLHVAPLSHSLDMGVVLHQSRLPSGSPHLLRGQHLGGYTEPPTQRESRVVPRRPDFPLPLLPLGHPAHRCVCHLCQHKMQQLLLQSGPGSRLLGRRVHATLEPPPPVSLPASASHTAYPPETPTGRIDCNPHRPTLATTTLVHDADVTVCGSLEAALPSAPPDTTRGTSAPPGPSVPQADGLEDLSAIEKIIRNARKPSTLALYACKWQVFNRFANKLGFPSAPVRVPDLLKFLLHLFQDGLSLSTVRVYVAAIASYQPPEVSPLFRHPRVHQFLKGLRNMRPSTFTPTPQWSLQLVLRRLCRPPFEPLASCSDDLLACKTLFLVAITSARRASELAALRCDQPYLQFHPDKVTLYPDITFLPKVSTDFHMRQPLVLPSFFPSPSSPLERELHLLDVRRALLYYTSRTDPYRASPRLFISPHPPYRGRPVSSQTVSKWITKTITLAYELATVPLPVSVRAHSTRALSTSTAFLKGTSIPDICRAATWATPLTFASHYRLDLRAKQDASFGRAVLSAVLS